MADSTTTQPTGTGFGDPLAGLTDQQLSKFELTGELPTDTKTDAPADAESTQADTPAEAAAAEPAEQAASRDAKSDAAPEAVKPEKSKKQPGQKKSAKERADEINAEAAEEERQLSEALERRRRARDARREAEREDTPKRAEQDREAAAPTSKDPSWKKYASLPDAPKSKDFETLDEFSAAMGAFVGEKVAEEKFNTLYDSRTSQQREIEERSRGWEQQASEGAEKASREIEADPEIMDRIDPRFVELKPLHECKPNEISPAHRAKDRALVHSNNPLRLLEWLSAEGGKELTRIARLGNDGMIAAIARQDAIFDSQHASDDPQDEAAATRQPSRVSKAPAPAPTLGKKAAAPKDPRKAPDSFDGFDEWNLSETKAEAGARS